MAITITVDPSFKKLTQDPSYSRTVGGVGREMEVIVNVAITSTTTYVTGGITLDFSGTGLNLRQVYLCEVLQGHGGFLTEFIPATGDAAATGKLKVYGTDPAAGGGSIAALVEIASASALIQGLTLRCRIRGIR